MWTRRSKVTTIMSSAVNQDALITLELDESWLTIWQLALTLKQQQIIRVLFFWPLSLQPWSAHLDELRLCCLSSDNVLLKLFLISSSGLAISDWQLSALSPQASVCPSRYILQIHTLLPHDCNAAVQLSPQVK